MKKYFLIMFIIFASCHLVFSQNQWLLQGGWNISRFNDGKNEDLVYGYLFGIGREWKLKNNFSVTAEINYSTKGGIIRDKAIKPVYFAINQDVYLSDIKCNIGYIEFPIRFKYNLELIQNSELKIHIGAVYSIPFLDNSGIKKKKYLFTLESNDIYNFEYFKEEEKALDIKSAFIYSAGFDFKYQFVSIGFYYLFDNRKPIKCDSVSEISKNIISYQTVFTLSF